MHANQETDTREFNFDMKVFWSPSTLSSGSYCFSPHLLGVIIHVDWDLTKYCSFLLDYPRLKILNGYLNSTIDDVHQ